MTMYDDRDPMQRQALERICSLFRCGVLLFRDDGERRVLFCNELAPALFGCEREDLIARHPKIADCIFPDDRTVVEQTVALALKERDSYDLVYRVLHKDGSTAWVKECGHRMSAPDAPAMILCTLTEISDGDVPDPLTQVLDGDAFYAQASLVFRAAAGSGRTHALLIADVDRFLKINDTFGHAFGDKVLSDAAQTLRSVTRTGDLLGRIGGDEFALLLKDVRRDDAFRRRIEQVCSLLHKPLPDGAEISCSIGVALGGDASGDYDVLLRRAEAAMRAAKADGGNRVAYGD